MLPSTSPIANLVLLFALDSMSWNDYITNLVGTGHVEKVRFVCVGVCDLKVLFSAFASLIQLAYLSRLFLHIIGCHRWPQRLRLGFFPWLEHCPRCA